MGKKLSVISFENGPDTPIRSYSLTNSLTPPPPYFPFDHPFLAKGMLFVLCIRGTAKLSIDLKEYTLAPNSIFTILPNQIFEPLEESEDHFVESLFFSTDFLSAMPGPKDFDLPNKIMQNPCLSVSEEDMKELLDYHYFIMRSYNRDNHFYNENITEGLIHALIALIASLYMEAEVHAEVRFSSRGEVIVDEFSKLLMKYHKVERQASFYSDKLCITTQYLSRTLKAISGRSVNTWITEAVILEAKALLKSSDMSVLQISEELNFSNPSFFIRYFKQYAGITPLKYRES